MEKKLLPSLLSADFYRLAEEMEAIERAGVEILHLDIMDGNYVPNLSFGPGLIEKLRPHTDLFFDAHLMVREPDYLLPAMRKAGCDLVTVHVEACTHLCRTLQEIKKLGMQAGVALNPATAIESLDYVMDQVDLILLMSVNPGFGGQSFIPSALDKIRSVRDRIDQSGRQIFLEVDGGIKKDNIQEIRKAGCDWFVAGSAVFQPGRSEENARILRKILEEG